MTQGKGASLSGPGSRPSDRAADGVSPVPASIPSAREQIEEAARDPNPSGSCPELLGDHEIMASIAISLKRLADAAWGTEGTSGLLELLNPLDVRNNY